MNGLPSQTISSGKLELRDSWYSSKCCVLCSPLALGLCDTTTRFPPPCLSPSCPHQNTVPSSLSASEKFAPVLAYKPQLVTLTVGGLACCNVNDATAIKASDSYWRGGAAQLSKAKLSCKSRAKTGGDHLCEAAACRRPYLYTWPSSDSANVKYFETTHLTIATSCQAFSSQRVTIRKSDTFSNLTRLSEKWLAVSGLFIHSEGPCKEMNTYTHED